MVVLAAVAVLSGCSQEPLVVVQRAGGSTMVADGTQPDFVMMANIEGTLLRTDQGCFGLELEHGQVVVLQLPIGSTLAEDGQGVTVPTVGIVRLGDAVAANGFQPLDHPEVPPECRGKESAASWQ